MARETKFYCALSPDNGVKTYAKELAASLERECGVPVLLKRSPPHLTVVPPFMVGSGMSVIEIVSVMSAYARETEPFWLNLEGPEWFTDKPKDQTLYLAVEKDERLAIFTESLRYSVGGIVGSPVVKDHYGYTPHVSLARHLSQEQAARVKKYLGGGRQYFPGRRVDTLVLYRLVNGRERSFYKPEEAFALSKLPE